MNVIDLKELGRKHRATLSVERKGFRRIFSFDNDFDFWCFIDSLEVNIPTFKLFAMDHSNKKVFIDL